MFGSSYNVFIFIICTESMSQIKLQTDSEVAPISNITTNDDRAP